MTNIYKIVFLLLITIHFSIILCTAQITFQKTIGGAMNEIGTCIEQTQDHGYIITGITNSFGAGDFDICLTKTDEYGNLLWTTTFGGSNDDEALYISQTTDGGFIITGYTFSFGTFYGNIYLIRTDVYGNLLWSKTYGGIYGSEGKCVQQTADGGFILTGNTNFTASPTVDQVILIKTDANGNLQWSKTFGGNIADVGFSLMQADDDGYIIVGITRSFGTGGTDAYMIRTNSNGDLLWSKTYGGTDYDGALSAHQTFDGGLIITGYTYNFDTDFADIYLIKTDANGDVLWSKAFGGIYGDFGEDVEQTADEGYIITGITGSNNNHDIHLTKTDNMGNLLWSKSYNGRYGLSVGYTKDNGYVISGTTLNFGAGYHDTYLIKTDSLGNSGCNELDIIMSENIMPTQVKNITPTITSFSFSSDSPATLIGSGGTLTTLCSNNNNSPVYHSYFFPNPVTYKSKFTFENIYKEKFHFTLCDLSGRIIENYSTASNEIILTKGSKPAGVYLFNLMNEKTGERWNGKIVVTD